MKMLLACSVLCLVAGCSEPFRDQGRWDFEQSNQLNLAAQVSDWRDLAAGHGDPGADGQEAAAAVDRLRRGVPKQLPNLEISSVAPGGAATSAAPPVAPTGSASP